MTILPVNGNGWYSCGMCHRPSVLVFLNLHNRFGFVYADQAERYYIKTNCPKTIKYLKQAQIWLKEESSNNSWNYELKQRLSEVEKILGKI